MLLGVIFDLDGTLVESYLDFNAMRLEMELPAGVPILETLETLAPANAERCWQVLRRHEQQGVDRAEIIPGAKELIERLQSAGIRTAVFTRNSRECLHAMLQRFGLSFDVVLSRDDAPAKPNPQGIHQICGGWGVRPEQVAIVGDYVFDLEAGRRAGTRTVLFAKARSAEQIAAWADQTDLVLQDFEQADGFLRWMTLENWGQD